MLLSWSFVSWSAGQCVREQKAAAAEAEERLQRSEEEKESLRKRLQYTEKQLAASQQQLQVHAELFGKAEMRRKIAFVCEHLHAIQCVHEF